MSAPKLIIVHTERHIEIELHESAITSEAIAEFSGCIFEIDDAEDLYKFAAEQLSGRAWPQFIEGLGNAQAIGDSEYPLSEKTPVRFREVWVDIQSETSHD